MSLILLVLLQPDLGMTILIALTFFCQLFIAGLPMMLVMYGLALILSLSALSYFFLDHVKSRIDSFLGNADTYQIDLSLMAFKSGGIFGKGPGFLGVRRITATSNGPKAMGPNGPGPLCPNESMRVAHQTPTHTQKSLINICICVLA